MKKNKVSDWMTANPITTSPKTSLHDAHKLMRDSKVRRLIVVDDGKLAGIIALSDVLTAEPSSATSLSVFELNYLLAKLTIDEIMTRNVITVPATATVRDAAKLMLDNKIGGLPVMDGDKIAGIITESDIFRLLVQSPELID
ncbi:MAG TPA: CBS domain-containing protein [Anaerolineae bacterium]|jgi:CBS domain-containing protein